MEGEAGMTRTRSPQGAGEAKHRRRESAAPARTRAAFGALAALLLLGACGKVGPVRPPGPADQVTYPRMYPNR
jgi:predicted small lipoprotein YifL